MASGYGRFWLSIVGLVVLGVSFYIIFAYSQYTEVAFGLLIGWMVTNFVVLYYLRPRGPPLPSNHPSGASPFPSSSPVASAPLPSGSSSSSSSAVGFCIYCANPVPPGTRACPSCGHTLPQW